MNNPDIKPGTRDKPYFVRRIKATFRVGFKLIELRTEVGNLNRKRQLKKMRLDILKQYGKFWNFKIVNEYIAIRDFSNLP